MNQETLVCGAAMLTLMVGAVGIVGMEIQSHPRGEPIMRAIDGDTIAQGNERLRLLYIDAPESRSSPRDCTRRRCPAGDPDAATERLQWALDSASWDCRGNRRDRYDRRLVECFSFTEGGDPVSLNEWMLTTGTVERYAP